MKKHMRDREVGGDRKRAPSVRRRQNEEEEEEEEARGEKRKATM